MRYRLFAHSTDKETEAQRGLATHQRSHSQQARDLSSHWGLFDSWTYGWGSVQEVSWGSGAGAFLGRVGKSDQGKAETVP